MSKPWRYSGAAWIAVLLILGGCAHPFRLPDSNQLKCYQAVEPFAEIPCKGTGQDGAYLINPLSYTDNGDGTVTDGNTGLEWQRQDDGKKYNWYKASGTSDAVLNPGGTDVCGSLALGGHTDWRLPSRKELTGIVDYAVPYPGPTLTTKYFSDVKEGTYWSSTTCASRTYGALGVKYRDFYFDVHFTHKGWDGYVRCVRGEATSRPSLTDNRNGTVTDQHTGLTWQQGEPGDMTWGRPSATARALTWGERPIGASQTSRNCNP